MSLFSKPANLLKNGMTKSSQFFKDIGVSHAGSTSLKVLRAGKAATWGGGSAMAWQAGGGAAAGAAVGYASDGWEGASKGAAIGGLGVVGLRGGKAMWRQGGIQSMYAGGKAGLKTGFDRAAAMGARQVERDAVIAARKARV